MGTQSSDPINTTFDPINSVSDPINKFTDPTTELLNQAIKKDGTLSYAAYGELIGVSEATIKRRLGELKKEGLIIRVGANKGGHREVLKMQVNI